MINIFQFRDELIQHYQSFSQGFTKIAAEDIRSFIKQQFDAYKRFCPEPLIQITPNYKVSCSIDELVRQGVLHPDCAKIFQFNGQGLNLFAHQYNAINMARSGKSYVVTSGTGSGKSLTFFIPIINAILQEKAQELSTPGSLLNRPRVRAIIIYPMNALANSQLEEIQKFLQNFSGIRVCRYTGQDDQAARLEMKNNLPDIILTNFMMLEQILIRRSDRFLVNACQDLRFLVLDELHTYRGRQGSDVAMLVRRLRIQMNARNLICIGTSATMASTGSQQDKNAVVANFASHLFGCTFQPEQVISETLDPMTLPIPRSQEEFINFRKQLMQEVLLAAKLDEQGQCCLMLHNYDEFKHSAFARWLEQNLSITSKFERAIPQSISSIAGRLTAMLCAPILATPQEVAEFKLPDALLNGQVAAKDGRSWLNSEVAADGQQVVEQNNSTVGQDQLNAIWGSDDKLSVGVGNDGKPHVGLGNGTTLSTIHELFVTCTQALKNFLSLFGQNDYIRTPQGKNPFAFKLHQFISGPTRIYVTLQHPQRYLTLDGQNFVADPQDPNKFYPLFEAYFCRDCGMEYIPVKITEGAGRKPNYIKVEPREFDARDDEEQDADECTMGFICPRRPEQGYKGDFEQLPDEWKDPKKENAIKSAKKKAVPELIYLDEYGYCKGNGQPYWLIKGTFQFCVNCLHTFTTAGSEKHRLLGLSGESRASVTTIISLQLIRQLYQYIWDNALAQNREPSLAEENACKLLGFVDNRQDAALQAGHFNDFVLRLVMRSSIIAALRNAQKPMLIDSLVESICKLLHFSKDYIHDTEALSNFMEVPQGETHELISVRFYQALEQIQFIFGMKIVDELRNLNLYTCPSLQELHLIKLQYLGLSDMCNSEQFMAQSAFLSRLSPEARFQIFSDFLDTLCNKQCIDSEYLNEGKISSNLKSSAKNILAKWIPQGVFKNLSPAFVLEKATSSAKVVLGTKMSGINRKIMLHKAWKTINCNLTQEDATQVLHDMISMLNKHGLLQQSSLKGADNKADITGYRIRSSVILLSTDNALSHQVMNDEGAMRNELDGTIRETILDKANDTAVWGKVAQANKAVGTVAGDLPSTNANYATDLTEPRDDERFFARLYLEIAKMLQNPTSSKSLLQTLLNIEAHEHTAQVSSKDREELEQRFRANQNDLEKWKARRTDLPFKRLPLLFCSPTMELGIDISALNYVLMRNVPPTAANYVQRAGRAGRSGQQSLVLTYCTARSPHDQWFFKHPEEMVQGIVNEPTIDLTNDALIRSHLHAIWLAAGGVSMPNYVCDVLDRDRTNLPVIPELQFSLNPQWPLASSSQAYSTNTAGVGEQDGFSATEYAASHDYSLDYAADELQDNEPQLSPAEIVEKAVDMGRKVLSMVDEPEVQEKWLNNTELESFMARSYQEFDHSFDSWRTHYSSLHSQLKLVSKQLTALNATKEDRERLQSEHTRVLAQIGFMSDTKSYNNNEFYVYRYLANQGFLPGYNFPSMPLQAWLLEKDDQDKNHRSLISRPRFIGLSEFAPFSLIYHQGRIFMSTRIRIPAENFNSEAKRLNTTVAHACERCGYITTDAAANTCEYCASPLRPESDIRNLYKISIVEATERERITVVDENRLSQGLEIHTLFSFAKDTSRLTGFLPPLKCELKYQDQCLGVLTYAQNALIKRINLGWRNSNDRSGFLINPLNGCWKSSSKSQTDLPTRRGKGRKNAALTNAALKSQTEAADNEAEVLQKIVPYVEDTHNLLILEPKGAGAGDTIFMATLQAALQRAIEQVYQLEQSELFVEPAPNEHERNLILIYEAGEGGSGVLLNLIRKPEAIQAVAKRALKIMHYDMPQDPATWDMEHIVNYNQNQHCLNGCYDCLLSYYNQREHVYINRRDDMTLNFLAKLGQCTVEKLSLDPIDYETSGDPTQSTPPATPLERFILWTSQRGYPQPDQIGKTFKVLKLSFDAAYNSEHICLSFTPRDPSDIESLADFGWTVLDLSQESTWEEQIARVFNSKV